MYNPISDQQVELQKRIKEHRVTIPGDLWDIGKQHRKDAEELARMIGDIDWLFNGDSLCLKFGGDGDNGEFLTYILDSIFELKEKENPVIITSLHEVVALQDEHRKTWRDKPESYWLFRLLEEVTELAGSLFGNHKHPVEWELKQIASICLNWLDMRNKK